jgi:hypothetical protein
MILSKGSDEKYCKFCDIKETCVYAFANGGVVDQDPIGRIWIRIIFFRIRITVTKSVQKRFLIKSLAVTLLYCAARRLLPTHALAIEVATP